MNASVFKKKSNNCLPVWPVTISGDGFNSLPDAVKKWMEAAAFEAHEGAVLLVPGQEGKLIGAVLGLGNNETPGNFAAGVLSEKLPAGDWYFVDSAYNERILALGAGLGNYRFERYKKRSTKAISFSVSDDVDIEELAILLDGCFLAKDLINTPVNDMGPDELEAATQELADSFDARLTVIKGDELLQQNFPMIHAVGRASVSAPRLLDMVWGNESSPKLTLVGKGVCFDTGGLDIKPAAGMLLMKKDMGGAANVLGLASMVMAAKLDVRLRVLIPAVENSISANAFRPSDVLTSRLGLTVEIGNTDAEGRLVLADALALGDEEEPDLMIDMATLTGAARVALGPDLSPFFSDDQAFCDALMGSANACYDPLWHMPLHMPYDKDLSSNVADLNNITPGGFGGAITAALFLKRFVSKAKSWVHFDIYGWNPKNKHHSKIGGEAMAIRATFDALKQRYE